MGDQSRRMAIAAFFFGVGVGAFIVLTVDVLMNR